MAKSTKRNISKMRENTTVPKGERLSIDITSSKEKSLGQNKYWLALMDEGTEMLWYEFLKSKDENSEKAYNHIMKMKGWGINISELTIRCDNAPENYSLKKMTERKGMSIKYEFTARGTPQQNGKLERKLRTTWGRTVAMLNSANLKGTIRGKLWAEAVRTATMLNNVLAKERQLCPHEKFFGKMPEYMKKPRIFGELGILKRNKKIFSKLENKGETCMFTGYSDCHAPDTYRLYTLVTKRIVVARDVLWTNDKHGVKGDSEVKQGKAFDVDTNMWIDDDEEEEDTDEMTIITNKRKVRFDIKTNEAHEEKAKRDKDD